ncbi:MAG: histone deacetylase family protein [Solirubrobacteraceae bacterium]
MAGVPVYLSHPSSLAHDTGAHPERAARITAIEAELAARGWLGFERVESPPVARDVLEAVHPARYVDWVQESSSIPSYLDPDTVVGPGSFEAALHGAGGAVRLAELLLEGSAPSGFSVHRPPGHHAEAARATGFCLFNHVAVAARYALDRGGVDRVLIFDWDVHHGNGTNDIFHASDQVLYISIHQSPLYPGTGPASDAGSGQGVGFTINLPVSAGAGDDVFLSLADHVVVPVARLFEPQLILVSAGYDAHREDPLANCLVTGDGFRAMAAAIMAVAADLEAPIGAVLEGGYALEPLARGVAGTMDVLAGHPVARTEQAPLVPLAADARTRLSQWWPELVLN